MFRSSVAYRTPLTFSGGVVSFAGFAFAFALAFALAGPDARTEGALASGTGRCRSRLTGCARGVNEGSGPRLLLLGAGTAVWAAGPGSANATTPVAPRPRTASGAPTRSTRASRGGR